jgi:tripartite-type tricarboxylate transporter receptor subunit TctC
MRMTTTPLFHARGFLHCPSVHARQLPYDPRDTVPIARVSNTILVIAVPTALKVDSMRDLVALAKPSPGKLNWAGITGVHEFRSRVLEKVLA